MLHRKRKMLWRRLGLGCLLWRFASSILMTCYCWKQGPITWLVSPQGLCCRKFSAAGARPLVGACTGRGGQGLGLKSPSASPYILDLPLPLSFLQSLCTCRTGHIVDFHEGSLLERWFVDAIIDIRDLLIVSNSRPRPLDHFLYVL